MTVTDYTKEHTKPLFNTHQFITVFNLYVYYSLVELYKILKFRVPYCMFSLFSLNTRCNSLHLNIPQTSLHCERQSFIYQTSILWNKTYKHILEPFHIPLNKYHLNMFNLTNIELIFYDYSTNVSMFKSKLSKIIMDIQKKGDVNDWSAENHLLPCNSIL